MQLLLCLLGSTDQHIFISKSKCDHGISNQTNVNFVVLNCFNVAKREREKVLWKKWQEGGKVGNNVMKKGKIRKKSNPYKFMYTNNIQLLRKRAQNVTFIINKLVWITKAEYYIAIILHSYKPTTENNEIQLKIIHTTN